ncbi:MAG: ribonuclease P protein component [Prevotella sp.]|jgi:ribonuclease P protein component|nr:ribonuclease P protein component [Prevotella sp.]
MTSSPKTFGKKEKLVSKKTIDALFSGGNSRSMSAYPLRVVFMRKERNETEEPAQVMVSVSKRHFKRAVKRNRVKRQIREAYRLNKHLLHEALEQKKDTAVAMAFIWQSDELAETALITEKMQSLLGRMAEKISR